MDDSQIRSADQNNLKADQNNLKPETVADTESATVDCETTLSACGRCWGDGCSDCGGLGYE